MARYLKSLQTGVVLPYNPYTLKSGDVREMSPDECAEYEASLGQPVKKAPVEEVQPESVAEVDTGVLVTQDIEDGEPDPTEVLEALKVE